jgi:hypothetical protein
MAMSEMKGTYIGDGVYAEFDGFQIWLRTDRGPDGVHEIALDADTFMHLMEFASNAKSRLKDLTQEAKRVTIKEGNEDS